MFNFKNSSTTRNNKIEYYILEENGTIRGHETHLHRKNKDSNQSSLQTRKFSKKYFTVFKSKL